jgi:hypothetical protein
LDSDLFFSLVAEHGRWLKWMGLVAFSKLNQQDKKLAELIIELNQQAKLAQRGRPIGFLR